MGNHWRRFGITVMMIQFCWIIACNRPTQVDARPIVTVFDGFLYVGSFPALEYAPPSHSHEAISLPTTLEAGKLYVFHYADSLDDAEFAISELPRRLRAAGATIIEAPSSKADLPSVDPGDRAWRVVFKYGALRGSIYNALDRDLFHRGGIKQGGNVNSFVLKFEKA